jgi:hypothetical protein
MLGATVAGLGDRVRGTEVGDSRDETCGDEVRRIGVGVGADEGEGGGCVSISKGPFVLRRGMATMIVLASASMSCSYSHIITSSNITGPMSRVSLIWSMWCCHVCFLMYIDIC